MTEKPSAKILAFPKDRIVRVALPEEMKEAQVQNHRRVFDMMIADESNALAMNFAMAGVNVADPTFQRNFALTMEFLRASLYSSADMEHMLQPVLSQISSRLSPSNTVEIPEEAIDIANDNEPC